MEENAAPQSESQPAETSLPVEVQVGSRMVIAQTILEEKVWKALKECYDPEIPVNIVELGLVYEMTVDDELPGEANVLITMTLTAPGCGMGPMIAADVRRRVQNVPGVRNVRVDLTFDPAWNPSMIGSRSMTPASW